MTLPDLAATNELAATLARAARPGDVIGLGGALGLGKTTFARAFINEMARRDGGGEGDGEEVPSPTFTLVQQYPFRRATVFHFDLYRIERPEEAIELGIEDAFIDGISLIEWPERLAGLLPAERLDLTLEAGAGPHARIARLTGHGRWAARLRKVVGDG